MYPLIMGMQYAGLGVHNTTKIAKTMSLTLITYGHLDDFGHDKNHVSLPD